MASDEVIVLAGGLGTRLRPVVTDLPKPLAPVGGKPFLEWVLRRMAAQGVRRVVLATGYLSEKVEQAVGHSFLGMTVVYSVESLPLGTGGAIAQASRLIEGGGAHIVNGDTYLDYDLQALELLVTERVDIGMALAKVDDVYRYGAVKLDGDRVSGFSEKGSRGPGLINAGCYFLSRKAMAQMPEGGYSFETEVLAPAVDGGRVAGLIQTRGFIDMGVPEDYQRAQSLFGVAP